MKARREQQRPGVVSRYDAEQRGPMRWHMHPHPVRGAPKIGARPELYRVILTFRQAGLGPGAGKLALVAVRVEETKQRAAAPESLDGQGDTLWNVIGEGIYQRSALWQWRQQLCQQLEPLQRQPC